MIDYSECVLCGGDTLSSRWVVTLYKKAICRACVSKIDSNPDTSTTLYDRELAVMNFNRLYNNEEPVKEPYFYNVDGEDDE